MTKLLKKCLDIPSLLNKKITAACNIKLRCRSYDIVITASHIGLTASTKNSHVITGKL